MSVLNPNTATGSLGFSDLDNQASFKTSTSSMGLSSGGFTGSQDFISNMGGGIPITGGNSGDASSTTHAAISDGTITVRDTEKQQQNVADLSRDVEHANNALSPIFDKEKEQNRLREINLIGEIGNQVADIARTQGKIAEEKALKDPKAIQAAKEALAENGNLTPTNKQLVEQIRNTASASYGTGSDLQRAIQAATAITQGLTGGNIGQALAGGSAPYLAHEISKYLPADQSLGANLMAHAVLGAVVGHFSGNATVGAVSAFTAEAAAPAIIKAMGWDKDSLTEKQKQTVSALATLAAGLAGGLVGDSSSSAVAGAQAGKNAVENNTLSSKDEKLRQDAKWSLPYLEGNKKVQAEKLVTDLDAKDKAFDAAIDAACKNLSSEQCSGMRQELAAMGKSYDEQMDGQYIGTMASVYKEGADKIDGLMWQYATADAQAQKAKDIQTIASNWGVSIETASALYTGMAITHTTAAIGGAVYGMKTEVPVTKGVIPTGSIADVKSISATEANAPFVAKGWGAPYDSATQVRTFTTASDLTFVRVSTVDNPVGGFLVRADEIAGMTPTQIQKYLALPKIPTQIADVLVPAGTKMQVGKVAAQPQFDAPNAGGVQYQLLQQIPTSSFGIPKSLK
ncbi:TPA: VENN motif pre-toxin domain-containing protein [Yersinia enterocolitica]